MLYTPKVNTATNNYVADDFAVITSHFNPANWTSTRDNYRRFLHEMTWWRVPVFSAEIAFDGQAWASDLSWLKIRGTVNNIMWQKERLLNLIVERLPAQFTKIAWIDADMLYLDRFWVEKTIKALETHTLVQIWNKWHCTGPDGNIVETLNTVGENGKEYISRRAWSPGGAWAGHRRVFPLYDRHVVGSGDNSCFEGWTGIYNTSQSHCELQYTEKMREDLYEWSADAYSKVKGDIGTVPFDAVHLFHGSRKDRAYRERWKPMIECDFDPKKHVTIDHNGLLAWTSETPPEIVTHLKSYFSSRLEDSHERDYAIFAPIGSNMNFNWEEVLALTTVLNGYINWQETNVQPDDEYTKRLITVLREVLARLTKKEEPVLKEKW